MALMSVSNKTIQNFIQSLTRHSRPFLIPGDSVDILYSPDQFFSTLKDGVARANHRVIFSSLYLGTQKREQELVSVLGESLSDKSRPDLHCSLLLDYLRGSRGTPNSRTMLQQLVKEYRDRFKLHLYHTPNLRGLLKWAGPQRFNEVMGLQHMKIYIFDDDLVLSGANLSRDYFVDRQDRYTWFKNCPQLTDFFAELVQITSSHSFSLKPDGSTEKPVSVPVNPLSSKKAADNFRTSLSKSISELIERECTQEKTEGLDTVVFPLVQMGYYGIRQDEKVAEELLQGSKEGESMCLASGYFNLPPKYVDAILKGQGEYSILAASPQANGFYGGKGVAGHVPVMYIHFAKKFLEKVSAHHCQDRVRYLEYHRAGWTFHGKGLWYYPSGEQLPVLSLMGSSNYGHRSLVRDLEAQVALVTTNQNLRESLHQPGDHIKYLEQCNTQGPSEAHVHHAIVLEVINDKSLVVIHKTKTATSKEPIVKDPNEMTVIDYPPGSCYPSSFTISYAEFRCSTDPELGDSVVCGCEQFVTNVKHGYSAELELYSLWCSDNDADIPDAVLELLPRHMD